MSGSLPSDKYWKILKDGFYVKTDFRGPIHSIRLNFKRNSQGYFPTAENPRFERRYSLLWKEKLTLEENHEGGTNY